MLNKTPGGAAPKSDVAQAETQLETAQVQDTDIGVQRTQYEHAIAILIGKPPAAFALQAAPSSLRPPDIPVGVPADLLERRPDIAGAERRVAAASEQIGIARAAFFPTVILSAAAGFEGSSIINWLNWPSRFWAVGPTAVQTLFDAGRAGGQPLKRPWRASTQQPQIIAKWEAGKQHQAVVSARESLQLFTNRYKGCVDTIFKSSLRRRLPWPTNGMKPIFSGRRDREDGGRIHCGEFACQSSQSRRFDFRRVLA
jgi:hypothetical protein